MSFDRKLITTTGSKLVPDLPAYVPESNNLWVFCNGKKEYVNIDYQELNPTTIRFLKDIPSGTIVECLIWNT